MLRAFRSGEYVFGVKMKGSHEDPALLALVENIAQSQDVLLQDPVSPMFFPPSFLFDVRDKDGLRTGECMFYLLSPKPMEDAAAE